MPRRVELTGQGAALGRSRMGHMLASMSDAPTMRDSELHAAIERLEIAIAVETAVLSGLEESFPDGGSGAYVAGGSAAEECKADVRRRLSDLAGTLAILTRERGERVAAVARLPVDPHTMPVLRYKPHD